MKSFITGTLRLFKHHYQMYCPETERCAKENRDMMDITAITSRINGGDCGTAAIAVGIVLREKYGIVVEYCDNVDHAFIKHDGQFFDTVYCQGTNDQTLLHGAKGRSDYDIVEWPELYRRYLRDREFDVIGHNFIKTFCAGAGLNFDTIYDIEFLKNTSAAEHKLGGEQEFDADITIIQFFPVALQKVACYGIVYNDKKTTGNHPFPDGAEIRTSSIKNYATYKEDNFLLTHSGTKYRIIGYQPVEEPKEEM